MFLWRGYKLVVSPCMTEQKQQVRLNTLTQFVHLTPSSSHWSLASRHLHKVPRGVKAGSKPAFKTAKFCRKFNYPLKWNHQKQIKSALCWVQMCASTELIGGSGELQTPRWRKLLYPIVSVASLKTVTLTSTTPIWLCELIMIIVTIANKFATLFLLLTKHFYTFL